MGYSIIDIRDHSRTNLSDAAPDQSNPPDSDKSKDGTGNSDRPDKVDHNWADWDTGTQNSARSNAASDAPNNSFNPATAAAGAQALQSGLVRSAYDAAVSGLDGDEGFLRTLNKGLARTFDSPTSRAMIRLARPELGPKGVGMFENPYNPAFYQQAVESAAGSANVPNAAVSLVGTGFKFLGGAALLVSVYSAAKATYYSDNHVQTGVIQAGRLAGSIGAGYVGGYLVGEISTIALGAALAAGGVVATPAIAITAGALAAFVAISASMQFAPKGAEEGERLARQLYDAFR